jgi:hypothetical protein
MVISPLKRTQTANPFDFLTGFGGWLKRMKRKVQKPLVLQDDTPFVEMDPTMPEPVAVEPDVDLDMVSAPFAEPESEPPIAPVAEDESVPDRQVARTVKDQPLSTEAPLRILPPPPSEKGARSSYAVAMVVTIIWAAVPLAFFYGYSHRIQPFTYEPFTIALLAAWAIGSIGILWIAARLLGQSLRLGAEIRYTRAQAASRAMVKGS